MERKGEKNEEETAQFIRPRVEKSKRPCDAALPVAKNRTWRSLLLVTFVHVIATYVSAKLIVVNKRRRTTKRPEIDARESRLPELTSRTRMRSDDRTIRYTFPRLNSPRRDFVCDSFVNFARLYHAYVLNTYSEFE